MTIDEWLEIAADIGDAWGREISDNWARVWYGPLAQFDAATVREAVGVYASRGQGGFMPNGGQLASICRELTSPGENFADIWARIDREVRRTGHCGKPELDGMAARVVEAIGWRNICLADTQELNTIRAQARRMVDEWTNAESVAPIRARLEERRRAAGELTSAADIVNRISKGGEAA